MESMSLSRDEWEAVARDLEARFRESAPPGLRDRVAELLHRVPRGWGNEMCSLDVDAAAAEVVRAIVRRGRGQPADPALEHAQRQSVAEAERIVRECQGPDPQGEREADED